MPVLLLIFNRPAETFMLVERLRLLRPRQVYVFADGPRVNHPEDAALCESTRSTLAAIDWPCSLRKLQMKANLGCIRSVLSAVTWFFQQVPAGIILEDDCIPSLSFFPFCQMLLDHYREDKKVFHISGWSSHGEEGHATSRFEHYMY